MAKQLIPLEITHEYRHPFPCMATIDDPTERQWWVTEKTAGDWDGKHVAGPFETREGAALFISNERPLQKT